MKKYYNYLVYVLQHKFWVMVECFKYGLYWQGIVHDFSKLLPSEFIPYANHFYGSPFSKGISTGRNKSGYYKPTEVKDEKFQMAWFLHTKRNKHHYQYWILNGEPGENIVYKIPDKYAKEMVADWKGAARAQGTRGIVSWYRKNKKKLWLHEDTRAFIVSEVNKCRREKEKEKGEVLANTTYFLETKPK